MMGGVTVAGGSELMSLLEVIANPDKAKAQLEALQKAKNEADEAAAQAQAKLAELAAAQKNSDDVFAEQTDALNKNRAAAEQATRAANAAKRDAEVLRDEVSVREQNLVDAEKALKEREKQHSANVTAWEHWRANEEMKLDALQKTAEKLKLQAESDAAEAATLKASYESKLAKLKALAD